MKQQQRQWRGSTEAAGMGQQQQQQQQQQHECGSNEATTMRQQQWCRNISRSNEAAGATGRGQQLHK